MKVRDLIAILSDQDPTMNVHIGYQYGDHSRTTVAPEIDLVEEKDVIYSEYHRRYRIADNEEKGETQKALVLFE